ncbi:unnamed protein product, partial [Phaeothamnion confervicola]
STTATETTIVGTASTWYYFTIAVTSAGAVTFYINGSSAGTGTVTQATASAPFYIGRLNNVTTSRFNGYMSDFRVYDAILSSGTISTMYTRGPNDFTMTVAGSSTDETSTGSDGTITVTVTNYSGSYTLVWSDGSSTSASRTGLTSGSYTVTATSTLGGTRSATFTISYTGIHGYIARYKFNDSTLLSTDTTGSFGLTATGTPTTGTDATYGTVLSLDGTNYYTVSTPISEVIGDVARTICYWGKANDTTQRVAFSYGTSGSGTQCQLTHSGNGGYVTVSNGSVVASGGSATTSWRFVATTYTGGSAGTTTVYLNNSLFTSTTAIFTATSSTNALRIGSSAVGSILTFNGNMVDFRVYSKVLSTSSLSSMY